MVYGWRKVDDNGVGSPRKRGRSGSCHGSARTPRHADPSQKDPMENPAR